MGFFNLSNVTIFVLLIILELNLSSGASVGIEKGSPSKFEDNGNKVKLSGFVHLNVSMKATLLDGNVNDTICFKPVIVNHGNVATATKVMNSGKVIHQELQLAPIRLSGVDPVEIKWIFSDDCNSTDEIGTTVVV
ncbi:uncharacterized protein LOC130668138 [Microplitis mediator]|uniref:uncharacterized protein LOC130668138 n=1 Tax=Microplitis mediator TaxID=375433 RepID=UPI002552FDEC|nr:uncharacterized protein LOC130668138 [Microplitis mediator]